jgi:hypothetical protein
MRFPEAAIFLSTWKEAPAFVAGLTYWTDISFPSHGKWQWSLRYDQQRYFVDLNSPTGLFESSRGVLNNTMRHPSRFSRTINQVGLGLGRSWRTGQHHFRTGLYIPFTFLHEAYANYAFVSISPEETLAIMLYLNVGPNWPMATEAEITAALADPIFTEADVGIFEGHMVTDLSPRNHASKMPGLQCTFAYTYRLREQLRLGAEVGAISNFGTRNDTFFVSFLIGIDLRKNPE